MSTQNVGKVATCVPSKIKIIYLPAIMWYKSYVTFSNESKYLSQSYLGNYTQFYKHVGRYLPIFLEPGKSRAQRN